MKKIIYVIIIFIVILFFYGRTNADYIDNFTNNNKQITFKEALEDIKEVLDKNNIKFHLHTGTALGAIRENKFIEYDYDIDIAIFKDDIYLYKLLNLLPNKFRVSKKYPFNRNDEKDITEISVIHKKTGVRIDISTIEKINNKYYFYTYTGPCDNKPKKRCTYVNSIYKLKNHKFFGKYYQVPEIKFLEELYGEDWRTPKNYSYSEGITKKLKKNIF